MRIPRIYHPEPITSGSQFSLCEDAANHIGRVLRMGPGQALQLFDGSNQVFDAEITNASKKSVDVKVLSGTLDDRESPLHIHLGQVMSRGEKMEFTIQKSIELGVSLITPLFSERCGVKLDSERLNKKRQQWQKIAIAACEQCGRNRVPEIRPAMDLEAWCAEQDEGLKLNLHPRASASINTLPLPVERVRLLIGPEGGLSADEIAMTARYQFTDILLGPRVLRTETTALTAITIASINIKKDSSFAMLLEAQRRGYELHYMEMADLYLINGEARARTRTLSVEQNYDNWYTFNDEQDLPLADLDVILMRKDPPFDTEFIYATYILERAEEKGALIVNKPQSLRDCNEKLFTAWFSDLTPETLVTRNKAQLKAFWQKHSDIILKPLDGMGGASIFRVKEGDPNLGVIAETLTEHGTRYCMAQNYLPAIKDGDKRVLVVDGEPVPYCLARIPQGGETRGNLAAGGRGEPRPLTDSDWEIARRIGPTLKAKGLIFVGLDIIGDRLTEINVTSPTCIREIEAEFPVSITGMLMDAIEARLQK